MHCPPPPRIIQRLDRDWGRGAGGRRKRRMKSFTDYTGRSKRRKVFKVGGEKESCIVRTRSRWKILSTYCPESGKPVCSWSVDKWSLSIVLETCKPSEFRIMVFKDIRSYSLEPVNVALYGKRVLADMINLRILRWDYLDLRPKCNQKCPCKKEVEGDST